MMQILTPAQLREDARSGQQIAEKQTDPNLKRQWASYAVALAELAEQIELVKPSGLKNWWPS
jgi:hypothetical protein